MPHVLNLLGDAVGQQHNQVLLGTLSTLQPAPTSFASPLYVCEDGWDPDYYHLVTRWAACHGTALPQPGATVVLQRLPPRLGQTVGDLIALWWSGSDNTLIYPSGDTTGATDDLILATAITSLPNGGTITLANGHHRWLTGPDAHGSHSLTIQGLGGLSAGATCATLVSYLGTGTAVNFRSTYGAALRNLQLVAASPSFTGRLVDFSHDPTLASDSALFDLRGCYLGITGTTTSGVGAYLDQTNTGSIGRCYFVGGQYGIQGTAGAPPTHYANGITVENTCRFSGQGTAQIYAPGAAWNISGANVFEALADGSAGGIVQAFGSGQGGEITDNWFGDVNQSKGGTQIQAGSGCKVEGNYVGGSPTTTAISVPAGVTGVEIGPNVLDTHALGVGLVSTATDVRISPTIRYLNVTTKYTPPTAVALAGAGTGATVALTGSDQGGSITLTTGSGPSSGDQLTVTFASTHSLPRLTLTPFGANAAGVTAYLSAVTTITFTVALTGSPAPSTAYVWHWALAPTQ